MSKQRLRGFSDSFAEMLFLNGLSTRNIGDLLNANHRTIRYSLMKRGVWKTFDERGRKQHCEWVRKRVVRPVGYVSPLTSRSQSRETVMKRISAREGNVEFREARLKRMLGNKLKLGYKATEETKLKLKALQSRPELKELHRQMIFKRLQKKEGTSIEQKVVDQLRRKGIKFIQQFVRGRFIFDVYLPDYDLLIECDGDYWHSLPSNRLRDERKDRFVMQNRYKLLRLKGSVINKFDFEITDYVNLCGDGFVSA